MSRRTFIKDPSLVLYLPLWKKDGQAFTSEDRYGHLCTVTGATWGIQGRTFDGNAYIDCGSSPSITRLTEEAWVRGSQAGETEWIISSDDGSANRNFGLVYIDSDNFFANIFIGGVEKNIRGAVSPSINTWYHVVATYDGSFLRLYVDAVLDGTPTAATGDVDTDATSLYVGRWGAGSNGYKGIIGEARIYNRALSLTEIEHNYQATKWRYR